MAPKTQTTTARRGRPAKVAASEPAIPSAVIVPPGLPKKRGRPAKTDTVEVATVEPAKKRGRPTKTQVDEPIAQIDNAIKRGRRSLAAAEEAVAEAPVSSRKRVGRPAKVAETVIADAVAPKKRGGRPRKEDVVPEASATPKRRGRPALDLNRVAGPSRVAKRTSQPSKPLARAPSRVTAAPRPNATRSRLQNRTVPVEKVKKQVAQPVKKARGRPKKIEVNGPAPKKTVGRGRKASAPVPAAPAVKVTARPKSAAPRKRRGYTAFEVPDKFAAQVKQLIADLQAEDAANAAAAAGEADDEGEEVDIEVEIGPEDANAELEEEETTADLAEEDDEDNEDEHTRISPADIANVAALDQEQLAREEDTSAELATKIDDLDDETELPSETAVLAEIAAVQDELDVQDAIQVDVQTAEATQPEIDRQSSPSNVSVDFHQETTEVSLIPQVDGSKEVDVLQAHIDGHEHIHENIHATEPAVISAVSTLLGGL